MEFQNSIVIPLHHNWKYLNDCCDLLNEEWPRSQMARMHSLQASCDNLPTSLVLLLRPDTNEELIVGHSKISVIHNYPSACFVESVVIAKKLRGKGWGKYIMQETEKYVKRQGKIVIFLTTSDKEEFYAKLGYIKCEPVSMYGCRNFQIKNGYHTTPLSSRILNRISSNEGLQTAPLPPPLPSKKPVISFAKTYMMKTIS